MFQVKAYLYKCNSTSNYREVSGKRQMSHRQNLKCMNYYTNNNVINVINMYISTCPMLQDISPRVKSITKSQNIRLERTSGIINFSQQKHCLDKMVQHLSSQILKASNMEESTTFLGRFFQWLIVFIMKIFLSSKNLIKFKSNQLSISCDNTILC